MNECTCIDEPAIAEMDELPKGLELPPGVIFNGFQEYKGDRLLVFSDRETGGTFMLIAGTTKEELAAAVGMRRVAARRVFTTPARKVAMGPGRIAR